MNRTRGVVVATVLWALLAGPARAEKVLLTSGELLIGPITKRNERAITIAHPVLGLLVVPVEHVQGIYGDAVELSAIAPAGQAGQTGAPAPSTTHQAPAAPAQAAEPVEPVIPPAPDELFWGWQSMLDVGFSGSTGNTEALNLYTAFTSKKESQSDRWDFDTSVFYAKNNRRKTQNKFTIGLTKDWLMPDSQWFYYALGRFDYDEFRSWDKRITAGGGLGYQWFKLDNFEWLSRGGVTVVTEFVAGPNNDITVNPEVMAGNEFIWRFLPDQTLTGSSYIYPDIIEFGQFRLVNTLDWKWKLSNEKNISLKFGLKHDYESDVSPGIEHNDLKYYGALTFEF